MTRLNLHRITANAASILSRDVLNRATTFILYALVARHLGTYAFGQLSLALAFFYVFQVFAVGGLRTFITREVSKDTSKTNLYLINGSLIVVVFSLICIIILFLFVCILDYSTNDLSVCH